MKKLLLIMLTFMASFSVYAQEVNTDNNNEAAVASENTILGTFVIDISDVMYPYIINIPAPSEPVIGVSGPPIPYYKLGVLKMDV